jgi:hypothetical protein
MSKMSDDRKVVIVAALEAGSTMEEAARAAHISSRTIHRWAADDPAFAELVDEARALVDDRVEAVTLANCLDPEPCHNALRMFWLRSRRHEVYGDRSQLDVTSKGEQLNVTFYLPSNGRDGNPPPANSGEMA